MSNLVCIEIDGIRYNGEVFLAAAQVSCPEYKWELTGRNNLPWAEGRPNPEDGFVLFDPFADGNNFRDLERVLKKEGWEFGYDGLGYWAKFYDNSPYACIVESDDSDTVLLLRCVAGMVEKDLFVEDIK